MLRKPMLTNERGPAPATDATPALAVAARAVSAPCPQSRFADLSFLHSRGGLRWRIWDFAVAVAAFWIAFALSPYTEKMPAVWYLLTVGALYGFLLTTVARTCGVPQPEHGACVYELLVTSLLAVAISYFIFNAIVGLTLVRTYGRYIVGITLGLSMLGVAAPRYVLGRLMARQPLGVMIYGAGSQGRTCVRKLLTSKLFRVVGFLDHKADLRGASIEGVPVLGPIQEWTPQRLLDHGVALVVLCVRSRLIRENAGELAKLRRGGVELLTLGALFEQYFKTIEVDCDSLPLLASRPLILHNSPNLVAKRLLDLAVASTALILTLPLWPLLALLIRLDSRGPALFRQTRVRRHGELFTIYKFRTMCLDAEKDGAQWAAVDDPRVTRLGRLLRLTRLDELPQLWNVVKGDMSLVGPRPERPEFVEHLSRSIPFYDQRHLLPPGLTGWAQILYRYGASEEDARHKLAYDLYYIRNMSLSLDLEILLRTVPLLMRGSR